MFSAALAIALMPQSLGDRLAGFIEEAESSGGIIAVHVSEASGRELFEHAADVRLVPASNAKIFTVVLAFERLGAEFRFATRFWREPDGIWVDAPGDMTLTPAQLTEAARILGCTGRDRVFVRQAYDLGHGSGWELDDLPFRYAPRLQSFSVNRAQFEVTARDGHISVADWTGVRITRHSETGEFRLSYDLTRRRLHIWGASPTNGVVARFALPDPAASAAGFFGRDIRSVQKVPSRAPDHILLSPPIRDLARLCLEPSDNLIAENMFLSAISHNSGDLTHFEDVSTRAAVQIESEFGLTARQVRLMDGSGLSRHSLVTARSVARILHHVYAQPYRQDFLRALPSPGQGTLRNRQSGLRVFAKTGSLDSVSCLSGFLDVGRSEPLVFSILMNHHELSSGRAQQIQDGIVAEMDRWARGY